MITPQDTREPKTFGGDLSTPAVTGFAIASPILALAEGTRTITLTLSFDKDAYATVNKVLQELQGKETPPFCFYLSTKEKMVSVKATVSVKNSKATSCTLQAIFALDPQFPPVAPWTEAPSIQTPWPLLQIFLADLKEKNDATHRAFASLVLRKVQLEVKVEGITQLTLQNDDGVLNGKKPFEPFGFSPVIGFGFYFAHPELCCKRLDTLKISIDWLGAPGDFKAHYQGYAGYENPPNSTQTPTSPIVDNKSFKAQLKLYDNRTFFDVGSIQLFAKKTSETNNQESFQKKPPGYCQDLHPSFANDVVDWNRYWKIELLEPDFQHALYPRAAAGYAARKDANGNPAPYIVNPPYTPKIKRLTLGYQASVEIDPEGGGTDTPDKLYHIEPFGYRELAADDQHHWLPEYPNEGELFIGIEDLAPPQTLSLLFQIAEGSADPDVAREPIHWDYLDGNGWKSLEQGGLLSDSTNGLINAGIITFNLPPAEPGTLLPADLYWIRASIAKNSRSVGSMVGIHAQAVSAGFIDQNNAQDHLNQPLPAKSITGLAEPLPAVKAIHQPYSSVGGKGPEQAGSFYTRVSERLRHKDRALTCWDYEHLILESFPDIYKVKCLPVGTSDDPRQADGIKIIVIPDIRGKLPSDPFKPKVSADRLLEIEQCLNQQISPLASFTVNNPTYIPLRVRLGVRFRTENNPGFYQQELEQALKRYLAPWAYDQSAEIVFGGKVNANLIVNFVERLPYVDYVAGIKLFAIRKGKEELIWPVLGNEPLPFPPDAILVSYLEHVIDPITEEVYEEKYFTGINYMKVETDFEIA